MSICSIRICSKNELSTISYHIVEKPCSITLNVTTSELAVVLWRVSISRWQLRCNLAKGIVINGTSANDECILTTVVGRTIGKNIGSRSAFLERIHTKILYSRKERINTSSSNFIRCVLTASLCTEKSCVKAIHMPGTGGASKSTVWC